MMRKIALQSILALLVLFTLQACTSYPALTAAQLKGPAIKVQVAKLASNQTLACAEIKPFRISKTDYLPVAQEAGILPDDFSSLRQTADRLHITITLRDSNKSCVPHLRAGMASKGHDVLTKTFTAESLPPEYQYLAGTVSTLAQKPKAGEQVKDPIDKRYLTKDGNPLTCDYDLMDVARADGQRVEGESAEDLQLRNQLNENLPWRGQPPSAVTRIMHGAQAEYSNFLRTLAKRDIEEKPITALNKPETPLTALTYSGEVYRLPKIEDALNFYRCHNIVIPPEWNIQY